MDFDGGSIAKNGNEFGSGTASGSLRNRLMGARRRWGKRERIHVAVQRARGEESSEGAASGDSPTEKLKRSKKIFGFRTMN